MAKFITDHLDAIFLTKQRFQIQFERMIIKKLYRTVRVTNLNFCLLQCHCGKPVRVSQIEQAYRSSALIVVFQFFRRLFHFCHQLPQSFPVVAYVLVLITSGTAAADEVLLTCWGTVELMQQGKRANPIDERSSLAVAVDIAKKTLTINGVSWPIIGDAMSETIVSMDPDKGGISLNRITGAINVHFIEINGLKKFYGECKPAQKLF
jgi:hypothetical protein